MKDWFPIIPNLHVISYGFCPTFQKYTVWCERTFSGTLVALVIKPIIDQSIIDHYYQNYLKKIIYEQLYEYLENFLSELLCGFWKARSMQHAFFRLIQKWQEELDSGGHVGTVLMDLSKAYDCLSHDLLITKLEAYRSD